MSDAPRPRRTPVHTRRTRTFAVAAVAVVGAVALPLLVIKASRTIANSKAGRTATSIVPVAGHLPATPAALLVEVGAANEVMGLTVLALGPSGSGGAVVIVPAGTEWMSAGSDRAARLGSAYDNGGGLGSEQDAVESVLGITTSLVQDVDEAGLTQLLTPYAPLHVVFDERVVDTDGAGQERVLFPGGAADLTAAQAARVLLAQGPNESEITRLPRTAAVWAAVLAKGAAATGARTTSSAPPTTADAVTSTTGPVAGPEGTLPETVAGQLAAIVAGPAAVRPLPVRPVLDPVANPDGLDLVAADNAGQKLLMAEVLPGAISPANSNIRFRVANATGDPNRLYDAVARLVFVGANVVVVSQPPTAQKETVIEYQDET